jgi:hypothetical protein
VYWIHFDIDDAYREKHFAVKPTNVPTLAVHVEGDGTIEEVLIPQSVFLEGLVKRGGGWSQAPEIVVNGFTTWRRQRRSQHGGCR